MSLSEQTRVRRTALYTCAETATRHAITSVALWPLQRVCATATSPVLPRTLPCDRDLGVTDDGVVCAVCVCAGEAMHGVLYVASDDGVVRALRCVARTHSRDDGDDDDEVHVAVVEPLARVVLRAHAAGVSNASMTSNASSMTSNSGNHRSGGGADARDASTTAAVQLVLAPAPSLVFACVDGGVCALDALTLQHVPHYFDSSHDDDDDDDDVLQRMLAVHRVTLCCLAFEQQSNDAVAATTTTTCATDACATHVTRMALLLEATATETTTTTTMRVLLLDCSTSTRARMLYRDDRSATSLGVASALPAATPHTTTSAAAVGDASTSASPSSRLRARAQRTPCTFAVPADTSTMAWRRHHLLVGARAQYCLYDVRTGQLLSRLDTLVPPLGGVLVRYMASCSSGNSSDTCTHAHDNHDDGSCTSDGYSSSSSSVSLHSDDDEAATTRTTKPSADTTAAADVWPAGLLFRTGAEQMCLYTGDAAPRSTHAQTTVALASATPLSDSNNDDNNNNRTLRDAHDERSRSDHVCDALTLPPYVLGLNARNEVVCLHTVFDDTDAATVATCDVGSTTAAAPAATVCVPAASFARAVVTPLGLLVCTAQQRTIELLQPEPMHVQVQRRVACGAYTSALRCCRMLCRTTYDNDDDGNDMHAPQRHGGCRRRRQRMLQRLYCSCAEHALRRCAKRDEDATTTARLARCAFDYFARAHTQAAALLLYFPELQLPSSSSSSRGASADGLRLSYACDAPYRELYRVLFAHFMRDRHTDYEGDNKDDDDNDDDDDDDDDALRSVVAFALLLLYALDATTMTTARRCVGATRDKRDAFFVHVCRLYASRHAAAATAMRVRECIADAPLSSSRLLPPADVCLAHVARACNKNSSNDNNGSDDDAAHCTLPPLLLACDGRYEAALQHCRRGGAVHEAAVVLRMCGEDTTRTNVAHDDNNRDADVIDTADARAVLYARHLPWMLRCDRGEALRVLVTPQTVAPAPLCVVPLLRHDAEALYHYLHFVLHDVTAAARTSRYNKDDDDDDSNNDISNSEQEQQQRRTKLVTLHTLHACNLIDMIVNVYTLVVSDNNDNDDTTRARRDGRKTSSNGKRSDVDDDDMTRVGVLGTLRRTLCRFLRRAHRRCDADVVLLRLRDTPLYEEQLTLLRCRHAHAQALSLLVYTLDDLPHALRYCAAAHAARRRRTRARSSHTTDNNNNKDDGDDDDVGTRPLYLPRAATIAALCTTPKHDDDDDNNGSTTTSTSSRGDAAGVATWPAVRVRDTARVNVHLHVLLHTLLHPPPTHAPRIDDALHVLHGYADQLDAQAVLHILPDTLPLRDLVPYLQRVSQHTAHATLLAHVDVVAARAATATATRRRVCLQQRCVVVTAASPSLLQAGGDSGNDVATRCAVCRQTFADTDTSLYLYPNLTVAHAHCISDGKRSGGGDSSGNDHASATHGDAERCVPYRAAL